MTTLHILNKPPHHPRFERCLEAFGRDDRLLLTESAVLAVSIPDLLPANRVSALSADLEARGLSALMQDGITPVDYDGMVALTAESAQIIHW
jgi:tRNA 2-thiouridine synthesizing protein B